MAKQDSDTLCFPGENGWELWAEQSGRMVCIETRPLEEGNEAGCEPFRSASHYAFPVNSVFAVPIWTATDSPEMLGSLVEMQLEKSGLKPESGSGKMLDYRTVQKVDSGEEGKGPRNLVLATVLNADYDHPLPDKGAREFDVSPRFMNLPGNHIVIWRELGRLVAALTRGGEIVYFQGLNSNEFDSAAVQEIRCVLLGLEGAGPVSNEERSQDILSQISGIHVWLEDADKAVVEQLQQALDLDTIIALRPDPVFPSHCSGLLPGAVALQREQKKRALLIRNVILALAACYLAFLGMYFFKYFNVVQENKRLSQQVAELEEEYGWIAPFEKKWREIEPVIAGETHPSELLHQCTLQLPEKDVRFTSFSVKGNTITIIGECRDPNAGRRFGAKLMSAAAMSDYKWEWLQRPTVNTRLKDGTATFRLQGGYKFGNDA
jgi:Tfp pilus assembly protein PilN